MKEILENIKSGKSGVVEALESLPDSLLTVIGSETLFNLAIKFNHTEVIEFFLANKKCIELLAPIDDEIKRKAKMISNQGVDLESVENAVFNIYGEYTGFYECLCCRHVVMEMLKSLINCVLTVRIPELKTC